MGPKAEGVEGWLLLAGTETEDVEVWECSLAGTRTEEAEVSLLARTREGLVEVRLSMVLMKCEGVKVWLSSASINVEEVAGVVYV